eukprot:scpid98982/ scgid21369/ Chromatin accessibility complex protein 1; DNA polymerase epsilon subunit p15; NF-YC-like protein; YC-like protein 1
MDVSNEASNSPEPMEDVSEAGHHGTDGGDVDLSSTSVSPGRGWSAPSSVGAAAADAGRGEACAAGTSAKSVLPGARVKTIMKSAPDSMATGQDAVFLVSRSTEYFIAYLTKKALAASSSSENIDYRAVANAVSSHDNLLFLNDVVPKKVLARDYLASLQPPS